VFADARAILNLFRSLAFSCRCFLLAAAQLCGRAVAADSDARDDLDKRAKVVRRFLSTAAWIRKGLARFGEEEREPFAAQFNAIASLTVHLFERPMPERGKEVQKLISGLKPATSKGKVERQLSDFLPPDFDPDSFRHVPLFGQYRVDSTSQIGIAGFPASCTFLQSIQRPCRLALTGTNGVAYDFLIKGNEDLRRDQRLMQFFELLNHILQSKIRTYSITPLDAYLGVVQWVTDAPLFHDLVNIGWHQPTSPPDLSGITESTPRAQRIAMFERAQEACKNVMRDALWIIARNSERWLLYQTAFAQSLAVMSMVGYLIGLGDRHLQNLLFEKRTGIVVHIDFGLIFDEAITRTHTKEYVPFRATRSLAVACGPLGFNGAFRRQCERTFGTLRQNQESMHSVLKLFEEQPVRDFYSRGPPGRTASARDDDSLAAQQKLNRVIEKLRGNGEPTDAVVRGLIQQATSSDNLSRMYGGWRAWI
jgi:phosphatidylinositol kinase/protein kinase (PI-3  family)